MPPLVPASLEPPPSLDDSSPPPSPPSADELDEELSPVLVEVAVEVVDVEVVSIASFSAEVSLGGVMSGVLLGVTSETLLPPHELRPIPPSMISALAPNVAIRER